MSKILIITIAAFVIVLLVGVNFPKGKWYNCSISEISPDFPPQVKEECRKLRSDAYKNGRI
jgi:hypothetical protein